MNKLDDAADAWWPANGNTRPAAKQTQLLWHQCVNIALDAMREALAAHRTLSLPNVRRIFECRWHAQRLPPTIARDGRRAGRQFLQAYYLRHQPFREK